MEIEISTPALLFPAVSLLLLAYTNRFLTTGQLIRLLSTQVKEKHTRGLEGQIANLKRRVELTKWMQFFGVLSMILCTISMFGLFLGFYEIGKKIFGLSLITMCISLFISLWEVYISSNALNMELKDLDSKCDSEDMKP
jgi:cell division protein FtsL